MAKLLLLVVCVSVASGSALPERAGKALSDLRASHHSSHSSSHHSPDPNKCVDISRYGEVQYKEESFTLHGYVCDNVGYGHGWNNDNTCERNCETKTEEICLDVESTWCDVEAYADCDEESQWLSVDETETVEFTPKRCWEDGTQVNWITIAIRYIATNNAWDCFH